MYKRQVEHHKRVESVKKEFRGSLLWINMREKVGVISPEDYCVGEHKRLEEGFERAIISLHADLKKYEKL